MVTHKRLETCISLLPGEHLNEPHAHLSSEAETRSAQRRRHQLRLFSALFHIIILRLKVRVRVQWVYGYDHSLINHYQQVNIHASVLV